MPSMYTERALLESRSLRDRLSHRVEVLDLVKELPLLPDGAHVTAAMLADYLEADAAAVGRIAGRHREELEGRGYRLLEGAELAEFLASNLPGRRPGGRGLGVFPRRAVLTVAMLLADGGVASRIRERLIEGEATCEARCEAGPEADAEPGNGGLVLVRSSFPGTGQPIRIVMIGGEPWFSTADVCKILDRGSPHKASKLVDSSDSRTVDLRSVTRTQSPPYGVSAGEKPYPRGNPLLNVVSEAGLYTLIMRSDKPAAKPFQRWVTGELLPSVRRGDADVTAQQRRMAETLAEAIGHQVRVVADIGTPIGHDVTVMSDGTVHCRHGEMEICVPGRGEDSGPPFGPYYRCPEVERVGIRGSRHLRPCGTIKFVDVVRRLADPTAENEATVFEPRPGKDIVSTDSMFLAIGNARVHGTARQIAEVLRDMGVVIR